jgi:CheY-like chemotaxis protein
VRSAPRKGTTFTLKFQRARSEGRAARMAQTAALPPPRRILLVDDDPRVRQTMATLLRTVGQQVVEADGGVAALALLGEQSFDLVFTDLGMPDMTGWQVAEAVKRHDPALPVVLITGWQDQVTADVEQRRFTDAILRKPARIEELLQVIRDLSSPSPLRPRNPTDS